LLDPRPLELSWLSDYLFVVIVLLVGSPFFFNLLLRLRWRIQSDLRKKIRWEISPDNLRVLTPNSTSEMTWAAFSGFVESKNLFLLYPSKLMFYMFPKRAFGSSDAVESFRELIKSKVPPRKQSIFWWR
jgi:hypothetical protein